MIAKVKTIVRNNSRLTVREIADGCGISVGSCEAILTDDLHMKRVCVEFVWRLLTDDQREQRQIIGGDLLQRSCEDVQFLKNIVTSDESWVYGYDREKKTAIVTLEGSLVCATKEGARLTLSCSKSQNTKVITVLAKTKYCVS